MDRSSLNRMLFALGLLVSISVIGVVGFVVIEGYDPLQALYMTIITMSTVGFGWDEPPSEEGKIFSVFLIVLSAGTFLYAISTITTFILEGEIQYIFNRYQVNKKVSRLKNHIILCGLGRNGREAALELIRQGKEFVIIDSNHEVLEEFIREEKNVLVIEGDATHEEILESANILQASGLISSLSTDAENVYVTLTARGMNPQLNIVARASQESSIPKLKRAGANSVIIPNLIGGRKMTNVLTRPALNEFVELITGEGNPNLHLEVILCADHKYLVGKTLAELHIRSRTGALVLGFKRGNKSVELNPPATDKIREEDRLFLMGTDDELKKFKELYLE